MTGYLGNNEPYVEEVYGGTDVDVSVRKTSKLTKKCLAIGYANFKDALEAYDTWEKDKKLEEEEYFGKLPRGQIKFHEIPGTEYSLPGDNLRAWEIECEYSSRGTNFGDSTHTIANISFSTTAESKKITGSISTRTSLTCLPGWGVVNFGGAIGWNGEEIEGVDVMRPTLTFTYDEFFPYEDVNDDTMRYWAGKTGCINNDSYLGFEPGEVLFFGVSNCSIEQLPLATGGFMPYWKMTFEFKIRHNETVVVGSSVPFSKRGWDHQWIDFRPVMEEATGDTVKIPVQVNVEQVYKETSFSCFTLQSLNGYLLNGNPAGSDD